MVPDHPFNEMKPNSGIGEVFSKHTPRKNVSKQPHHRREIAVPPTCLLMDRAGSMSLRAM
jgi:hypothetical protein